MAAVVLPPADAPAVGLAAMPSSPASTASLMTAEPGSPPARPSRRRPVSMRSSPGTPISPLPDVDDAAPVAAPANGAQPITPPSPTSAATSAAMVKSASSPIPAPPPNLAVLRNKRPQSPESSISFKTSRSAASANGSADPQAGVRVSPSSPSGFLPTLSNVIEAPADPSRAPDAAPASQHAPSPSLSGFTVFGARARSESAPGTPPLRPPRPDSSGDGLPATIRGMVHHTQPDDGIAASQGFSSDSDSDAPSKRRNRSRSNTVSTNTSRPSSFAGQGPLSRGAEAVKTWSKRHGLSGTSGSSSPNAAQHFGVARDRQLRPHSPLIPSLAGNRSPVGGNSGGGDGAPRVPRITRDAQSSPFARPALFTRGSSSSISTNATVPSHSGLLAVASVSGHGHGKEASGSSGATLRASSSAQPLQKEAPAFLAAPPPTSRPQSAEGKSKGPRMLTRLRSFKGRRKTQVKAEPQAKAESQAKAAAEPAQQMQAPPSAPAEQKQRRRFSANFMSGKGAAPATVAQAPTSAPVAEAPAEAAAAPAAAAAAAAADAAAAAAAAAAVASVLAPAIELQPARAAAEKVEPASEAEDTQATVRGFKNPFVAAPAEQDATRVVGVAAPVAASAGSAVAPIEASEKQAPAADASADRFPRRQFSISSGMTAFYSVNSADTDSEVGVPASSGQHGGASSALHAPLFKATDVEPSVTAPDAPTPEPTASTAVEATSAVDETPADVEAAPRESLLTVPGGDALGLTLGPTGRKGSVASSQSRTSESSNALLPSSIFGDSNVSHSQDGHDTASPTTPGFDTAFTEAQVVENMLGGQLDRNLPPLSSKQRVVRPFPSVSQSPPAVPSTPSAAGPTASPMGANLHLRAGSIRSVQPSILGGSETASIFTMQGPGASPHRRAEQLEEERFWSGVAAPEYEPALPVGTAPEVVSGPPLPEQLQELDDTKRQALTKELIRRELHWELRNLGLAEAPLLGLILDNQPEVANYFREAVWPLMEAFRRHGVSAYVDRHGEGDGTRFSAASLSHVLHSGLISMLTSVIATRFGGCDPARSVSKLDATTLSLLPYRVPVQQLRNGGFEIDIVAARGATYVLRIRRPSRWDTFIFRNEQHFEILRRNLISELGAKLSLPVLPGAAPEPRLDLLSRVPTTSSPPDEMPTAPSVSSHLDTESVAEHALEGRPQSAAARMLQDAAFAPPAVKYQTPALLPSSRKPSVEGIAQWPARADMRARADPRKGRVGRAPSPPPSVRSIQTSISTTKVKGPVAESEYVLTAERSARAKELRSWLRDVLAVRGVGHSRAMQAFLASGKLLEDDLKKEKPAVEQGIAAQARQVAARMEEAQRSASSATEMVVEVQTLLKKFLLADEALQCTEYLKHFHHVEQLPRDYQLAIKYISSRLAHVVYGVFVSGDESSENLSRTRSIFKLLPWQAFASSMRSPTFAMLDQIKCKILQRRLVQGLLDLLLQDDAKSIDEQLQAVRLRLKSNTAEQKLINFVKSSERFKAMVRKSAAALNVPLVVAIVRGSDKPQLKESMLKSVISATKAYTTFMATRPNAIQQAQNTNRGYRLIRDLQALLRIHSLRHDGKQIRAMIAEPAVADAIAQLFSPVGDLLCQIQRLPRSDEKLLAVVRWAEDLLDLCQKLRVRIQDPARSMAQIGAHLHAGLTQLWGFLHHVARETPDALPLRPFYALLRELEERSHAFDLVALFGRADVSPEVRPAASAAESLSRQHALRAQELFVRSVIGDCEEEHSVLTIGDMAGRSRKEPFFPRELPARLHLPALDSLLPAFRSACSSILGNV